MVASMVGKPLRTDSFTTGKTKLQFARVLFEVFAAKEIKHVVKYRCPNGIVVEQKVEYDWLPPRCPHCLHFGHNQQYCKVPKVSMDTDEGEDSRICIEPEGEIGQAQNGGVPGVKAMMECCMESLISVVPETILSNIEKGIQGEQEEVNSGELGEALTRTETMNNQKGLEEMCFEEILTGKKTPIEDTIEEESPFIEVIGKAKSKRLKQQNQTDKMRKQSQIKRYQKRHKNQQRNQMQMNLSGKSQDSEMGLNLRSFARRTKGRGIGAKLALF